MNQKKSGKMFGGALFHFEKRESHKDGTEEKKSEVILTAKSTVIISISLITLVISFLTKC